MKRALLLCLLFPSLAFGQAALKVKLIDFTPDKIGAACGYQAEATTLKFALLADGGTLKRGQKILVKIVCPADLGRELYENNRAYVVTLYSPAAEPSWVKKANRWHMASAYEKERLPRFWSSALKRL